MISTRDFLKYLKIKTVSVKEESKDFANIAEALENGHIYAHAEDLSKNLEIKASFDIDGLNGTCSLENASSILKSQIFFRLAQPNGRISSHPVILTPSRQFMRIIDCDPIQIGFTTTQIGIIDLYLCSYSDSPLNHIKCDSIDIDSFSERKTSLKEYFLQNDLVSRNPNYASEIKTAIRKEAFIGSTNSQNLSIILQEYAGMCGTVEKNTFCAFRPMVAKC
ncbi:hypothetical protein ENBRE01_2822 [Enteropsectra breve]|nr:hypothetical protein ENBRE01_2256 [Enteropsectra breve]KAI5152427.1 hypothetical protein ENBRE01_2822 [Enteropsectra breve]